MSSARCQVERLQVPTEGLNTSASANYIPPRQSRRVENLLPGQGRLYLRGPITRKLTLGAIDPTPDIWTSGNKVLIKTVAQHRVVDAAAGTVTTVSPARVQESSRHARVGDFVYGAVTPTAGAIRDLGMWNPAAGTVVTSANAPVDFIDLKQYASRLFVLGGSVPGTTPIQQFNLYWSDTGGPSAGTLAQWQDDVSGLTNIITYAQLDAPVALARCGRSLAILMRHSIYVLTGDGASSFALRLAVSGVGCLDSLSVVESADGCYFLTDSGYVYFDGSGVRPISTDILGPNGLLEGLPSNNYRASLVADNYLLVSKCDKSTLVGTSYLYSMANSAWTTLTSFLMPAVSVWMPVKLSDYDLAFDGSDLYDISLITRPEAATIPGRDTDGVSATQAIRVQFYSRIARLSGPSNKSQLQRALIDYALTVPTGTYLAAVELYDANGIQITQLSSLPSKPSGVTLQRYQEDTFVEADAVSIHVSTPSSSSVYASNFELYDMWIEFLSAQLRGTI